MSSLEIKEITPLTTQETTQIAKWYFEQWDCHRADASFEQVLELVTATKDKVGFFVHFNNEVAGAAEIKHQQGAAWLDGMYVDEQFRGLGISNALIEYAKEKAANLSWQPLYLKCEPHLVDLYEKFGFKVVEMDGAKSIMRCE
ncbi:GNAT family N-acetyltransferase [Pseudoalteromonas luteoviolacea]|uniref:N-acetyltransferase domain-containing protein n=1 Tax=Pseudoalteromonas luteoviolacea DSM 6061 TaxID=1365250 RepID=A0A166VYL4_9GAMM|nr:GNAT family N-acetyltransferase [Pseudoalteromonas luteoviolacea]KZN34623.1 hypothetical protein N475_18955 [Pseudoalteromonas luteoviolacea DSM 6061]MBE0389612.1 hypothetical protein [Pseudoalteromonas luteoviolacea DSM 6061]